MVSGERDNGTGGREIDYLKIYICIWRRSALKAILRRPRYGEFRRDRQWANIDGDAGRPVWPIGV